MIQYIPRVSISAIVNRIKAISTKRIWNIHQEFLQKHLWREKTFWTDGYFVCSVGEASPETIRKYIQNQLLCLIAFSPIAKDNWDFSYLVIKIIISTEHKIITIKKRVYFKEICTFKWSWKQ